MNKEQRFNRSDTDGMTQPEIAAILGVKRQVVDKIERRALRKLRAEFERRGIVASDFYDVEG